MNGCCPGPAVMGYLGVTGGEVAGLYWGWAEVEGYPGWDKADVDIGAGMLFFLAPLGPPAETGEPDGSMDMRSMSSLRRCCSWSAPDALLCSILERS
jgi:hypothetical protein